MEMLKLKRPLQICSTSILWKDSETEGKDWVNVAAGEELGWKVMGVGGEHEHLYSKTGEKDLKQLKSVLVATGSCQEKGEALVLLFEISLSMCKRSEKRCP